MSFDRWILLIGALTAFLGTAVAPVVIKAIEAHTRKSPSPEPQPQIGMTVDPDRADEITDEFIETLRARIAELTEELREERRRLKSANESLARHGHDTF